MQQVGQRQTRMAKKKLARTKKASSRKAGKGSARREVKAAVDNVSRQLKQMKTRLADITLQPGEEPDELAVQTAKDFAEQMQEVSRSLREALKNAMMAEGKIKPGQVLTFRGRRVLLKPRPGCPHGSMDPDHYHLIYEMIH
jgi:hypothetical protein